MIYARHVSNSFGGNIFVPDNECVGKSPLKYYLEKKEITREKTKKMNYDIGWVVCIMT